MSKLTQLINKDSVLKEWRQKTSVCLLTIGMNEDGIILALTGGLDKPSYCKQYCKEHNLNFNEVWNLIK